MSDFIGSDMDKLKQALNDVPDGGETIPCPTCGNPAEIIKEVGDLPPQNAWCKNCKCTILLNIHFGDNLPPEIEGGS